MNFADVFLVFIVGMCAGCAVCFCISAFLDD
jgi:hypothetical protein